jgi:hypothetical protein
MPPKRNKIPNPHLPEIIETLQAEYPDAHCELNHRSAFQRRPHDPFHVIVPGGLEQEQLGQTVGSVIGVEKHRPHRFGKRRSTGLAGDHHIVAAIGEPQRQPLDLRALAGSLPTFERDEPASLHSRSIPLRPAAEGRGPMRRNQGEVYDATSLRRASSAR